MFYTTSETEGEFGHVKLILAPSNLLVTVPKWQLCCGSLLPVFGVRVSVTITLMFVHIISVRFWLLRGHLLEKSRSLG